MAVGSRFVTISWTLHYIQGSFDSTDIVYWALRRHNRITNQLYSGISRVMNSKLLQAFIDHTLILGLWQGWSHLLWMSIKLNRKLKSIFASDELCCSWVDTHASTAWSTVTSRGPVETAHPTWYFISGNFPLLTLFELILRSRCWNLSAVSLATGFVSVSQRLFTSHPSAFYSS